jgi:hypothetical protein
MLKLAGITLAGILLITVLACHTHPAPPPPPPPPPPAPLQSGNIQLTTSITPSARTCDANPQQPNYREGATVTFHTQPGQKYSITFTNRTPFTTGGLTPPIYDGVTYTTVTTGSSIPVPFSYKLLDEGNCNAASQYIGIIVTH